MKWAVISLIPYGSLGAVTAIMGIHINNWQFWVLLACLMSADVVGYLRAKHG